VLHIILPTHSLLLVNLLFAERLVFL